MILYYEPPTRPVGTPLLLTLLLPLYDVLCLYICIYRIDRKLFISLEYIFLRKLIICFENMILSFDNMTFSQKVNHPIQKCDLFIQEYSKATPKWDETTCVESVDKIVSPRGRPNS